MRRLGGEISGHGGQNSHAMCLNTVTRLDVRKFRFLAARLAFNWQDVSLEKNNISEYGNIRVVNDTCEIYNTVLSLTIFFIILNTPQQLLRD